MFPIRYSKLRAAARRMLKDEAWTCSIGRDTGYRPYKWVIKRLAAKAALILVDPGKGRVYETVVE